MTTAKYAVIGWPVQHSVSPEMQAAAFAAAGLRASYERVAVRPGQLAEAIERLRSEPYAGWNVTVPHKAAMAKLVDRLDPVAERSGSVNTVVNRDGVLHGFSTDGFGLAEALHEAFGVSIAGGRFLFCGCGGAARAATIHFAAAGAATLVIVNRTLEKARDVARVIGTANPACRVACLQPDQAADLAVALSDCRVLIQATSLGLHAGDPYPMPPNLVPSDVAVMDMIYRRTPFLAAVAGHGCKVADGRGMLLHQGARSFEIWTGQRAPLDAMRNALDNALALCLKQE